MRGRTLWLAALVLGVAGPARAQVGSNDITREKVELTPFYGYRTGGGFSAQVGDQTLSFGLESDASYGGIVDFNLHKDNFKFEVLYSRQQTRVSTDRLLEPGSSLPLNVEYLLAGLSQEVGNPKGRFFVSALIGASRFSPQGFDSVTKFAGALGAGFKVFPSRHVGLRFDARAYISLVSGSGGAFCNGGTCLFAFSGSTLWQWDFTGGLILAF